MIAPLLLLAVWAVATLIIFEYVRHHPPVTGSEYARGFAEGERYQIEQFRIETPSYDRAYTAGWCALLDTIDQQEIDPQYTVAKEWIIVRRRP